jgi:DNA gyrase subunit A
MATKEEDAVRTMFVTSTHNPVLFFSTAGKVYRLKVWRLPEGAPQARGRPMVNLLPLAEGETISTVLPLPEDEEEWKSLHVVFATAHGGVRRNSMDSFSNVPSNGKFAMRFEEDATDCLIGVALLTEEDDVLLATQNGKAIRFEATAVREFQSRTSTGVRGISLKDGDKVISLSILKGFPASTEERDAYLRAAPWKDNENAPTLPPERMKAFEEAEEFILTVTANGYGKRTSAFEYRRTNRGGQGITNIETSARNGHVVASFPAHNGQQLMLVTDQAKMIRTTVGDIRIAGRNTQGVTLFRVAENEHVVSAARIEESEDEAEEGLDVVGEGAEGEALAVDDAPADEAGTDGDETEA